MRYVLILSLLGFAGVLMAVETAQAQVRIVVDAGGRGPASVPQVVTVQPHALQTAPADVARIRVLVPDAQAKVWFDGSLTSQTGKDRLFHTPTLAPGGNYSYRIRASWTQNGEPMIQEQVVPVTPGQTSVADFTRPVPEEK